ncbi:ester cyclase [Gracilibacillus alcaliphilus]|uniref:ester cyclase n=1 Tax=Gracilibacillus alcaliphilus TaxID=1401441 RepID=UPI00195864CC|nr:ester cyclase [Gracilibacillus alcaliphilus]MBM7675275.1 putative ester cyclase [Gracilibacillus alcaliphilus]
MKAKELYLAWVKAWNEDVSILDQIVSPACLVQQARIDGESSHQQQGPEALKKMITEGKYYFSDVEMTVDVGPIVETPYVSARWTFTGSYKGGMDGATAEIGKKVQFSGMDIFLVKDGQLHEYWVSSDGIDLLSQLGI